MPHGIGSCLMSCPLVPRHVTSSTSLLPGAAGLMMSLIPPHPHARLEHHASLFFHAIVGATCSL